MRPSLLSLSTILVIGALLAAAPGCGKKVWPKPDSRGEALALAQETAGWSGGCLAIGAALSGKPENLERVVLELAPADCPSCPFQAREQREFRPGGPGFALENGRLLLSACGLDPSAGVRWRLAAHNLFRNLPPAHTGDHATPPAGRTP